MVSIAAALRHDTTQPHNAAQASRTTELGWQLVLEMWRGEKVTAKCAFEHLRLNTGRIGAVRVVETNSMVKLDPKSADEKIFSVLQSLYFKKDLAKLLAAEGKSEEIAARLEKQLLLSKGKVSGKANIF